jgi:hypothetical protein
MHILLSTEKRCDFRCVGLLNLSITQIYRKSPVSLIIAQCVSVSLIIALTLTHHDTQCVSWRAMSTNIDKVTPTPV